MAQAKQSYFKKTHVNRYEKKKRYDDTISEKRIFESRFLQDQPKKLYQRTHNEIETDDRNSK